MIKTIPEVIDKGVKGTDHLGRVFVEYDNKIVGLHNEWKNEELNNHWVVSSYELHREKQALPSTPQAITKEKHINSLNSVEPNPTTNALKTQAPTHLSPLEQANAEKLAKPRETIQKVRANKRASQRKD
ncbi:DUF3519 domain-containing protein [Helicobacter pylori]|uniref:DUF3519 domain-containing protein n=1 Tax=Helicobacter pylori TaxID=210 RepID=UPI003133AD0B